MSRFMLKLRNSRGGCWLGGVLGGGWGVRGDGVFSPADTRSHGHIQLDMSAGTRTTLGWEYAVNTFSTTEHM